MVHPTVNVMGKTVILLSGYQRTPHTDRARGANAALKIEAPEQLWLSASKNPDAVAFGYMAGKWVASA